MDINTSYNTHIRNNDIKINKETASKLDKKKLKDASQGLEAEFLKVFLKQSKKIMFKDEEKENKAPGKDIMTDFMLERFAEQMAKSSPLGISEMIIRNVEKNNISKDDVEKDAKNMNNSNIDVDENNS